MERILVINPGSTSTKIAYYEDETEIWKESITHSKEAISAFGSIYDQLDMRYSLVTAALREHGMCEADLTAVVSRGGPIAPLKSGAYLIDRSMTDKILTDPQDMHPSLLGALIAYRISEKEGIKSYIYDAVTVDEMYPVCKVTGLPSAERRGQGHNLNMRAAALKYCKDNGLEYNDLTVIVAHLGGGISVSLHDKGTIADIITDEDGPFAPERTGLIPMTQFMDLCLKGGLTRSGIVKLMKGGGGLVAWFGTNDSRDVEKMILEGDGRAKLVYEAMALNVAKAIAGLSVVANGKVDRIILTGGIAYSELFTTYIKDRVDWISPVSIIPGENEMGALAGGCLRVLRGSEEAKIFGNS
jgi:butyrate kinase